MAKKYTYNENLAGKPIRFIEQHIRHTQGEWAGQPFLMEDWQKNDIIHPAFGWVDKTGQRKHKFVYVEIPKGNGKSYMLSALAIYLGIADGEHAAEVYCVAGDREQARIVFDTCKQMIEASPVLSQKCQVFRDTIVHLKSQSKIKVISAEAYSKHGYRPYAIIFDEMHVQPNRELYDTLTRGMIKRKNSMCWMITTAGIKNTFAETIHDYADKLASKVIHNEAWLPVLYAAPEDCDPFDRKVWAACNPGYGTIIDPDNFAILAKEAQNQPTALNGFKRLHLNIWTGATESWIPVHEFDKCNLGPVDLEFHARNKTPCYAGLDLASTKDLTALSLLFDKGDGTYESYRWYWCPANTVHDRTKGENVNYEVWVRDGLVLTTPGNTQDAEAIAAFVGETCQRFNVKILAFDGYGPGKYIASVLYERYGVEVFEFLQTLMNFARPTKKYEILIYDRKINHGGDPVLRWMIDNVEIIRDTNDNQRPTKGKSKGKIDGVIAELMALGMCLDHAPETSVYVTENRGFYTL